MAKGTRDLRQATVLLLSNTRDQVIKRETIIHSARAKPDTEEWIIVSWELEIQLLKASIETMEKWIIEDEYDY